MAANYKKRLSRFRARIGSLGLDSFIVSNETNVSYLSGFFGKDSLIFVSPKGNYLITDSRYLEEARESASGCTVELVKDYTYRTVEKIAKDGPSKRIGFESMNLPFEVADRLKCILSPAEFLPVKNAAEELRVVKDAAELALIKQSIKITKAVFRKIMEMVRPGITEKHLAAAIETEFLKMGAKAGFDPIVACGKNSSKPHAHPADRRIRGDSFVMIDLGCRFSGYNSDMTRMVLTGRVPARFKKIYDIVRRAQEKALKAIRPAAKITDVDDTARGVIRKAGFAKYFGHSLGHGVGMDVHEDPIISPRGEGFLKAGMVFTVEPAIYIPGFGGVRIEDMVLVTGSGCEVITR